MSALPKHQLEVDALRDGQPTRLSILLRFGDVAADLWSYDVWDLEPARQLPRGKSIAVAGEFDRYDRLVPQLSQGGPFRFELLGIGEHKTLYEIPATEAQRFARLAAACGAIDPLPLPAIGPRRRLSPLAARS